MRVDHHLVVRADRTGQRQGSARQRDGWILHRAVLRRQRQPVTAHSLAGILEPRRVGRPVIAGYRTRARHQIQGKGKHRRRLPERHMSLRRRAEVRLRREKGQLRRHRLSHMRDLHAAVPRRDHIEDPRAAAHIHVQLHIHGRIEKRHQPCVQIPVRRRTKAWRKLRVQAQTAGAQASRRWISAAVEGIFRHCHSAVQPSEALQTLCQKTQLSLRSNRCLHAAAAQPDTIICHYLPSPSLMTEAAPRFPDGWRAPFHKGSDHSAGA